MATAEGCKGHIKRGFHACQSPVWKDQYCKYHHPETTRARNELRRERRKLEEKHDEAKRNRRDAERDLLTYLVGPEGDPSPSVTVLWEELMVHRATVLIARAKHRSTLTALNAFDDAQKAKKKEKL